MTCNSLMHFSELSSEAWWDGLKIMAAFIYSYKDLSDSSNWHFLFGLLAEKGEFLISKWSHKYATLWLMGRHDIYDGSA